ncbi:MAG TPA: hypothetical protein VOA80_23290 [Thermoanaerobaculia bacterium]|nr:hypothetical protein [Thermoanaerobaculia bacterium]
MSIQRLLSLRAARRRREQHFTSRRPGRTTAGAGGRVLAAGRLACALASAALLALALAWSLHPLVHDDLFWHLRTGEWIAAHHRVPLVDLFSYTRLGARWITHEWGFSLASWLIYRAGGMDGLVVTTALLAVAIFAAIAWRAVDLAGAAAPPGPGPGAGATVRCLLLAALLALGLWAASPEIFLRAALAGELMLALVLAALGRYRRTGRRRWLAAIAALFWPWANLHSGVVFGLFLLALYALEPFVGAVPPASPASSGSSASPASPASPRGGLGVRLAAAAPLLWTLAAASALTLLNPNGLDGPLYPLWLARILYASGIPWELGHFSATAPTGGAADAALWLLLVLLLLALLPLRQARRLSPAEAASIAAFFVLTLISHRFVFDLVVVALPTLYKLLVLPPAPAAVPDPADPAAPSRAASSGLHGLAGRPALAAAVVALFLLPVGAAAIAAVAAGWARRPPAAGGLIAEPFPQAAVRFVAGQGLAAPGDRLFNHQNWGGFIGWRLHVPVFWDGRNDVFAELVRAVATQPFGLTASRYRLDWLLIAEHDYPGIQPEVAAGRWGLVYWDDFCAVYLRRGPRYAEPLGRLELRQFPPFGGRPGLPALAADPGRAAAARAELARLLAANPENQRARYFQGMISLYQGDLRRGTAELLAARSIRPNDQVDQVLAWLRNLPTKPAGGRRAM